MYKKQIKHKVSGTFPCLMECEIGSPGTVSVPSTDSTISRLFTQRFHAMQFVYTITIIVKPEGVVRNVSLVSNLHAAHTTGPYHSFRLASSDYYVSNFLICAGTPDELINYYRKH